MSQIVLFPVPALPSRGTLVSLLSFFLFACSDSPNIEGFDSKAWKNDKNGCLGERAKLIDDLYEKRMQVLGLSENETVGFLGHPDRQELMERGQKTYKYWIAGAPGCSGESKSKLVVIRFNAVNKAKEFYLE